jgi:hypothetical protein
VADPTTDAALALASGMATVTVTVLGVPPSTLLAVGCGAGFGMLATESQSRGRAVATFALTTIAGAMISSLLAREAFGGDEQWRNVIGVAVGLTFPAVKERAMLVAPLVLDAVLKRLGVGGDK